MFKNIKHELEVLEKELQQQDEPQLPKHLQQIIFIADAGLGFTIDQLCIGFADYPRAIDDDFEFLLSLSKQANAKAKGIFKMSERQQIWYDDIKRRLDLVATKRKPGQPKALIC